MDVEAIDVDESTIFVSVPSYRDPECPNTIADLLAKAKNPDRLVFGVCEQNEPGDQDAVPKNLLSRIGVGNQIRLLKMHAGDAKGPAYARSAIEQQLYDPGEGLELFMQIDSHTRVVKHWDALCVQDVIACEKQRGGNHRFVITMYPDNYDLYGSSTPTQQPQQQQRQVPRGQNQMSGGMYSQKPSTQPTKQQQQNLTLGRTVQEIGNFGSTSFLDVANFSAFHSWHPVTGMPMHYQYKFRSVDGSSASAVAPTMYHPTGFFSANFAIGRVDAWHEVPYDPYVPYLFLGEEQSMAARMFTHGWDLMLPKHMFVYSKSERDYRPVYWEQFKTKYNKTPDTTCHERTMLYDQSMARIKRLLWDGTIDNGGQNDQFFGLGSDRTLAQYESHVGFTFTTQTASVRSRLGVTGGATESEWFDKHGVSSSDWKKIYNASLQRNFMPLMGPAPTNIKTVSAREFIKSQQKQSSSKPSFGSAAFAQFQQRQTSGASGQQQRQQVPVAKPYAPPPPKLANGLTALKKPPTRQTQQAPTMTQQQQQRSTSSGQQKSAYQKWTQSQSSAGPAADKSAAVASYSAAIKRQQQTRRG